ncbi:MAG: protein TolQ [Gammaproteobacteria bacterium]|nr:protein TolQ [Gammaproteobacteria bacterium]
MSADMSLIHLITGASFLVQLVMLLLLVISLASWVLIFRKHKEIKDAKTAVDAFESRFWSGISMDDLHKQVTGKPDEMKGAAVIFEAGFRTFVRLHQQEGIEPREVLDGTQRAMRVVMNREIEQLESHLSFLATVGSTSPYIGLFGTVWGIMNSFRALGNSNQATLAMVAPGIAEALIATAMGLFAAIPAVVAYNRYVSDVDRLVNSYDNFLEEFSSILHRQVHS